MTTRLVRTDTISPYVQAEGARFRALDATADDKALVGTKPEVRVRASRPYGRVAEVTYPDGSILLWPKCERTTASRSEATEIVDRLREETAAAFDPVKVAEMDRRAREATERLFASFGVTL